MSFKLNTYSPFLMTSENKVSKLPGKTSFETGSKLKIVPFYRFFIVFKSTITLRLIAVFIFC